MAKFKDICTKIGSGATPKGGKEAYCEDGISLIRSQNVLDFAFSAGGLAYINELQAEKLKNVIVEEDDVLLNITGDSVARACRVDKKYLPARVNQHVCIIRADSSKAIPSYLLYYLQLNKEYLLQLASGGATRNALTKDMINNLELELPTIEEQQKVVAVLDDIQKKIDFNNAINENLEQQAKALYQQMFIENTSPDWIEGSLRDIADITMGQSPSGSSYNEDGIGAIFFQGRAEFSFRFPTIHLYTTEPKRMACANDILMSVRAPVGDLNIAHTDCCIGRGLAAIHSKTNHQSFVLYTMFSLRKQLDVFNGEGTVFGSINRSSLNDMPILIPSNETIEEFERIVAPMDAAIRNNYDEICRLQAIRDTLLPRLMSGELDVSSIDL